MSRYEDYGSGDSRRSPRDRDRSPGRYNDSRDSSHFSRGPSRGNDGPRRIDGRTNSDTFASNRDNFRGSISREDPRDFPSRDPPRAPRAVLDAPAGPRASSYGDFRGRGRGRGRGYRDDSRDRGWIDDRADYRDRRDVRRDSRGGPAFRSDDRSRDREWRDRETFRNRRPSPTGRGRSPDLRDIRDGPASATSDRLGRSSREGPPAISPAAPDLVLASPGFQGGYQRPGRGRGWGRGQPVDDRDRGRGRSRSPDLRGREREDREREAARYKRERERATEAREQRSPPPQAPQVPAFGSISNRSGSISGPVPNTGPPAPEAPEATSSASLRRLSDVPIPTGPKAQRQRFSGTHPGRPVSKTWVRPASPVTSAPHRVKKNNITLPLQQPTRKLPPSEDDVSESDSADDLNDDYFDLEHKRLSELLEKTEAQQIQSTIKPVLPCDIQSELKVDAHLAIDIIEEGDRFDRSGTPPLSKVPEPQPGYTNGSNSTSTTAILPPTTTTTAKREDVETPNKKSVVEPAIAPDAQDDVKTPRSPVEHDPLTEAMKKKKVTGHDAQNEATIPTGPGRQDPYGEGPILPPKARIQEVQREAILPPKVSTVILPPASHGHSMRTEPILPPSRIVPTSETPISRTSGSEVRNEPILPPKRPRESDSSNQPSIPSAVHVQNHDNEVTTPSGPLKQEPVNESSIIMPQPRESNSGVCAPASQNHYDSPVSAQSAAPEVAEEELIIRPARRSTPPLSSLPFPADEVPFYKNPTFIAGWTPDSKIKETIMRDLKAKSRKEVEERDAMAARYAKDYEVYLKEIGWPNGEKARNGASGQSNGTGGSGTNEGRPEGRRNASRFASQHELERILKESELEAEKQRTKKLVEDLTGSDPAKEAVIPPMKTIEQENLERFVDRNNLIKFEDSFRAFAVLQPVDNFTTEECETFEKAFFDYPKQWAKIAECLPGRDFGTCIQHYYLVKHTLELNRRLKEQRKPRKRKAKGKKPIITTEEGGQEEGTDTTETTGLRRRPPRGAKNQEQPAYASEAQPSESENNTPVPTPAKRGTGNGKREVSEAAPESKRSKDTPTRGRTSKRGRGRGTAAIVPGQRTARSPSQSNAELPKSARPSQPPSRSRTPMTTQSVQLDGVAPETILPPYPPLVERQNIVSSTPDITPFSYVPPPQERTENVPPTMTFDHQQQQDRRALQQTSSYWSVPEQQDFPALLKHFGTDWNGIAKWMTSKTHIMVYTTVFKQWLAVPSDTNKSRRVANVQTQVKNYYQRQVESGKPEYAEFAATADRKRDRGESTGPPPTPSMAPKRRYDGPPVIMPRSGESTMSGFEEYNAQQPTNMQQSTPSQPIISTRFPALAQAGPVQNDPPYPIPLPKKQAQPQPKQSSQTPPVTRAPASRGPHLGYFNQDRERPILQASTSHHAPVSSPMSEASVSQRSRQVAQEAQMEREQALRQQQRQEQVRQEQQRAAEQQQQQQRLEQQRLEQQRLEQQRLEQQRLEQQRLEQQRLEQQRLEQQRLEQQRLEQQRLEQQRLEQQRLEQQRLEQQRINEQRLNQQRVEQQRIEELLANQQRLEQHQQRQQERQMRLKQENDMQSSPHQYERYSAYPQQPGVMAPSRMESAAPTPIPPDMRRTAPPQQFAPRGHQSMRNIMSDSPGPTPHASSASPSPAITRAPFSAPPDQIQAMQSPAITAVRQQETPRKTSSIMSLLNDEPSEPKPAPPKRVSEVATSSVKPSQSPTQMYAQAGRSPIQIYQQQPSQSPSQMYQHRSQSPAPIYQQNSVQQSRYAAPPPQHVPQQQQMAPQSSSPLTSAPVSERDYYSRSYASQGASQQMPSQHQVSHSQPAYTPGSPHPMQAPLRQSMASQPSQARREPAMPNSMRLVESPYSAAAQVQPPRPVYGQPQPQPQRTYTPYENRGYAPPPPPPQQQLSQAQEQQMQQEMYRRQQHARQQEEENYRRGYGR